MKKEFSFEQAIKPNTAVHCATRELAKEFLGICELKDIKWCTGEKATETTYDDYCYNVNKGRHITCCNKGWYEDNEFLIVDFVGLVNETKPKQKYIVTVQDNTIRVKSKQTGNKGTSRCCPTDTFNFGFGVELAKARADRDVELAKKLVDSTYVKACKNVIEVVKDKPFEMPSTPFKITAPDGNKYMVVKTQESGIYSLVELSNGRIIHNTYNFDLVKRALQENRWIIIEQKLI